MIALRAEHAAARAGGERDDLVQLAEIVQHSLDAVRRIYRELRPEALGEFGLVNALIALCSRVSQRSDLRVVRRLEGPLPPLSHEIELAIYRLAQEALTNAMRHSGASEETISLSCAEGRVTPEGFRRRTSPFPAG